MTDAANYLGVSRPNLSNVLHGKVKLSPELSARIDTVYECYTQHLLQAQLSADIERAKDAIKALDLKRRFSE